MNIHKQLFLGQRIWLGPVDYEHDPQVMAQWSHDPRYLSLVEVRPVSPLSMSQVEKRLEALEKELEESKSGYYFTIRAREDNRLLGFATINWIEWTHASGWLRLGIGDRRDWRKGYGTEALDLLLEYTFDELNLYRLGAEIIEYNQGALRLFEKAGFRQEACRRQALSRQGRRWDILMLGLLRQEWEARKHDG